MSTEIKVEGLSKTVSKVEEMKIASSEVVQKETREGANLIRKRARQLAPRKTGQLRKSIRVKKCKTQDGYLVKPYWYVARFQEYGTKRGTPALHFMQRTREELMPQINENIMKAIAKVVEGK